MNTEARKFFNEHREAILGLLREEQNSKNPYTKLQHCYTDLNGMHYYIFPDGMSLPIERTGKLQDFYMYINTGMSATEWHKAIDVIDEALYKGLANTKVAGTIGAQNKVLKDMIGMVFHTELIYNMVAVQMIREDEQPFEFSQPIHEEKVAQFKLESKNNSTYFFFQTLPIKDLRLLDNFLKLSQAEFTALWLESEIRQMENQKINDYLKQLLKEISTGEKSLKNS